MKHVMHEKNVDNRPTTFRFIQLSISLALSPSMKLVNEKNVDNTTFGFIQRMVCINCILTTLHQKKLHLRFGFGPSIFIKKTGNYLALVL